MHRLPRLAFAIISAVSLPTVFGPTLFGQSVISAHSGLVNYFEGVVFLDGQPLARKAGMYARMKDGATLATEYGRAEVLLTPDTYIRIGEKSSIRMVDDSISNTRVELLSGSSILDSSKSPDGQFVSVIFKDSTVKITKPGHYRIDANPPQLRVFDGIAEVTGVGITNDGKPIRLQAQQLLPLDGSTVVKRFTEGSDGLLDLWSAERGDLIASNLVNSQTITDPLLDPGPGIPADLASYIGYVPVASIAPLGVGSYGLGYGPAFGVGIYQPFPMAAFLYTPRRYTPIFSATRPAIGTTTFGYTRPVFGVGTTSPGRTIFVPRPVTGTVTVPRTGVGARPAVHIGGRR